MFKRIALSFLSLTLFLAGCTVSGDLYTPDTGLGSSNSSPVWIQSANGNSLILYGTAEMDFSVNLTNHDTSHQVGGYDEISVAGLSGLLADDQHVLDAEVLAVAAALVHASRHTNGGADEISVAGLSGLLADDQHVLDAEVIDAVEAVGTHLVIDNGTGYTRLNTSNNQALWLYSDDSDASGVEIRSYSDSTTPANSDVGYTQSIFGRNSAAAYNEYARMRFLLTDVESGLERSQYQLYLDHEGTWLDTVDISSAGTFILTSPHNPSGGKGGEIEIHNVGTGQDNNYNEFSAWLNSDTGVTRNIARTLYTITDATNGSEDSTIRWYAMNGGTLNLAMYLTADGTLYLDEGTSVFDDWDDAKLLEKGIKDKDKQALINAGIYVEYWDTATNTTVTLVNYPNMINLLAGGIYQSRAAIDELTARIEYLESKVK